MPRGSNPNSKKALAENREKTQFRGDNAVKAGKKGNDTKKYMSIARNALKAHLSDEELDKQIVALLSRGRQGNLTAIKMIFDYTEPLADKEETTEEVNLAYLAPVSPAEEPPELKEGDAE